jgi:uncharacterized OsmC-like protein
LEAEVTGSIVRRNGRVRLAAVHANYWLPIAPAHAPAAQRALAVHDRACPASQSVQPVIAVTYDVTLLPDSAE